MHKEQIVDFETHMQQRKVPNNKQFVFHIVFCNTEINRKLKYLETIKLLTSVLVGIYTITKLCEIKKQIKITFSKRNKQKEEDGRFFCRRLSFANSKKFIG